jgi:broad specificity phosphatase PhoE
MLATWAALGEPYTTFRDRAVARIRALERDTVVFSHFVAINAVIGACLGDDRLVIRRLDNCSITVVDVGTAGLELVEGGHEADTLIR